MTLTRFAPRAAAFALLATLTALPVLAPAARAQEPTRAEQLIGYRQGTMTVIVGTFTPLALMANGKIPYDAKRAQVLADRLPTLAGIATEVFPPDSREGGKTKAKPEIWTDHAEFEKLLQDLVDKTAQVQTAAKAGTLDALKGPVGDLGKACKACHDKFKEK